MKDILMAIYPRNIEEFTGLVVGIGGGTVLFLVVIALPSYAFLEAALQIVKLLLFS